MAKSFLNLSSAECLEYYPKLLKESGQKWISAETVAERGDFGTAISLMIISSEDLIKGSLLFADGNGFKFRNVPGMVTLFRNHKIRYFIAYFGYAFGLISDEFKVFILEVVNTPEKVKQFAKKISSNDADAQKSLKYFALTRFNKLKRDFNWFKNIDALRQDGLYSNYEDELVLPSSLTVKNYLQVKSKLGKLRSFLVDFITCNEAEDQNGNSTLQQMRTYIERTKAYGRIEYGLGLLKSNQYDPFVTILKLIVKPNAMTVSHLFDISTKQGKGA